MPVSAGGHIRGILDFCLCRGKVFAVMLMLALIMIPSAAMAQTAHAPEQAAGILQRQNDPLAQKLVTWIYMTQTGLNMRAEDMMQFVAQNPDWPRLGVIRERIEKNISSVQNPATVLAWFEKHPPTTYDGLRAQLAAAKSAGQQAIMKQSLLAFWREKPLSRNEAAALAGEYAAYFTAADHVARIDMLVWRQRYSEAETLLPFVPRPHRALTLAKIALGRSAGNVETLLANVPPHLRQDEGLIFERMRWRRKKNLDKGAIEMLKLAPRKSDFSNQWWREINILARRHIEKGDYKGAYDILGHHNAVTGGHYAQAEWLMGWISLRFLKRPTAAYQHFEAMRANVTSAISIARAAYWLGRSADDLKNPELSRKWYNEAAQYPSTFYGQLAYARVKDRPTAETFSEPPLDHATMQKFVRRDTVRAARLLHKLRLYDFIDPFLFRLNATAKTKQEHMMVARLAYETGRHHHIVQANKDAQQNTGTFLLQDGYPMLPAVPLQHPDKALVHAIIYRESMFDTQARSAAGALGLMQLMPGTARDMARHTGQTYRIEKLTRDPSFNVLMGSSYLGRMLNNYRQFPPMAIAAYNAGPARVNRWITEIGDPRNGAIDVIDWVEMIPIYETRNYVQRVMETYYIYRLRMGEKPMLITDYVEK